jgi:hypothetical protein
LLSCWPRVQQALQAPNTLGGCFSSLAVATTAGALVVLWLLTPRSHDLTQALQLSSIFLQAQRSAPYALSTLNIGLALPSANASLAAFNGSGGSMPSSAITQPWMQQTLDNYPWLANATGNPADVVHGGYYMGVDYVKHTFPLATSMSMLAWSIVQFRPAFEQVGVTPANHIRDIIKSR